MQARRSLVVRQSGTWRAGGGREGGQRSAEASDCNGIPAAVRSCVQTAGFRKSQRNPVSVQTSDCPARPARACSGWTVVGNAEDVQVKRRRGFLGWAFSWPGNGNYSNKSNNTG
jgi:hypothetical protein